jgi:hypothetical protein
MRFAKATLVPPPESTSGMFICVKSKKKKKEIPKGKTGSAARNKKAQNRNSKSEK